MVLSQSERILLKEVKKTKINQLIQGEEDLEGDAKEREATARIISDWPV